MKRSHPRTPSERREWWRDRVKTYTTPFFANAPTSLSPVTVEREMPGVRVFSGVHVQGTRTHCFDNQKNRDRFLTKFRKFGAQAVGKDPCP